MFPHEDSEDGLHWADAHADLSFCWAQWSFSWFCHEAAHFRQMLKTKPEHDKTIKMMCAQRRRSAWASKQSDRDFADR